MPVHCLTTAADSIDCVSFIRLVAMLNMSSLSFGYSAKMLFMSTLRSCGHTRARAGSASAVWLARDAVYAPQGAPPTAVAAAAQALRQGSWATRGAQRRPRAAARRTS
eukprot:6236999-Prymnesium_polylepis.1